MHFNFDSHEADKMPQIYDRPVHELIRELISERLSLPASILTRQDTLAWFRQKYPKVRPGTVAAHLLKLATNDRTRLHYDAKPGYDDVLFKVQPGHFRLYELASDPPPITSDSPKPDSQGSDRPDDDGGDEPVPGSKFAYENDLRDYLAGNLSLIEPGLRLTKMKG